MPFCYALPYILLSEPRVYCYSRFGLFRVRSPLLAESHFDFSSSPYLDVSVQAVPLIYLCIQYMMTGHDSGRIAPFGYLWINACLRLPIAYRSLLRPSSAPSAKAFTLCPSSLDLLLVFSNFCFAFLLASVLMYSCTLRSSLRRLLT